MPFLLFLWLLCSLPVLCVQIDHTNPTLFNQDPPYNGSTATSLTGHATCYERASGLHKHADLEDCYMATRLILTNKKIILPQTFGRGAAVDFGLPLVTKYKTCMIVLDSKDADVDTFLLLRVAYYAAELIQPCVANRPFSPLGGQVGLDKKTFFVAMVGSTPTESLGDTFNGTTLSQLGTVAAGLEA